MHAKVAGALPEGSLVRQDLDTHVVLNRVAGLAARMAGVSSAIIRHDGRVLGMHGAAIMAGGFSTSKAFRPPMGGDATLELSDLRRRGPLTATELAGLDDLVAVIGAMLMQDGQATLLAQATNRAVRADLILRLVTEAPTCTGALTSLLEELCRHHDAAVGRIWRLLPNGSMIEESRFNCTGVGVASYYQMPPAAPVRAGNSWTAQAIMRNQPEALIYSKVADPGRFALLGNAVTAGLASQVSFPFWLGEERFGVSLAFLTERTDLAAVVADIASLANTIRPALFRKVTEERVYHMAHHDGLTQLGNRIAFNEHLQEQIRHASAGGSEFALLYLDLDGFKSVNDTHGHEVGDKLLVLVAQRLRGCIRDGDHVARLGGDEFAIIQSTLPDTQADTQADTQPHIQEDRHGAIPGSGVALARRVLDGFNQPFVIEGRPTEVGVSIGIARFPSGGTTPDDLLRSADVALYECKHSGRRTFRVFDERSNVRQRSRGAVREEVEAALDAGQFGLAFQPVCAVPDRRIESMEASLHWHHPALGVLAAAEFLPMVDAAGLSLAVGRWMLEAGCRAAIAWPEPWPLSLTVLPGQVRHPDLVAQVAAVLRSTGLPPARLDMLVPEHVLLAEAGLVTTLHALKELGVRVTLDGFGNSHAGLGWLRRITFDRIKLAPAMIAGLDDPGTLALVQAVLSLGRHMGIAVVADGVETRTGLERLVGMGCTLVQGTLTGSLVTAPPQPPGHRHADMMAAP